MLRILKQCVPNIITLRHHFSVDNYMKTFEKSAVTRHHGIFKVDEYASAANNAQKVEQFIKEEQATLDQCRDKYKDLTECYYNISKSRRDNRGKSIAEAYDNYSYFTKVAWHEAKQYTTLYRTLNANPSQEELVLDIMLYPYIKKYASTVQLIRTAFSPSHKLLAFGVDLKNNEETTFFISQIDSKHQLIKINGLKDSKLKGVDEVIFKSDEEIFYIKVENHRPCTVIMHNIITGEQSQIYHEEDIKKHVSIRLSKDKKFLFITCNSHATTELAYVNLQSSEWQVYKLIDSSHLPCKYEINHVQNYFLIWSQSEHNIISVITNQQVENQMKIASRKAKGKPICLDLKNVKAEVIFSCEEDESLTDLDILEGHLILYLQKITSPVLRVLKLKRNEKHNKKNIESHKQFDVEVYEPKLPYSLGSLSPGTNQNYQSGKVVVYFNNPFRYDEAYLYSIPEQRFQLIQKHSYTGPRFSEEKYTVQTINIPSRTGDYIPLTLIGPKKKTVTKMVLNFYGFYGISYQVQYDNARIAALEMGWTIGIIHVRGGSEKGKNWHKQAQFENKDRSWKDIEECVGYLLRERYTNPSLLFLCTHSAGAIAGWGAINHRPHLYKGIIFNYPFLDVLTGLLDQTHPLATSDHEEFGNPIKSKTVYRQIEAISPYENIENKQYPLIHIVAGRNDYRTPINQIMKFVKRFRVKTLKNNRFSEEFGERGVTVNISESASHLGEASIKDENLKACEIYGLMDYVINKISLDCELKN